MERELLRQETAVYTARAGSLRAGLSERRLAGCSRDRRAVHRHVVPAESMIRAIMLEDSLYLLHGL